jgi:hypothetical protein
MTPFPSTDALNKAVAIGKATAFLNAKSKALQSVGPMNGKFGRASILTSATASIRRRSRSRRQETHQDLQSPWRS